MRCVPQYFSRFSGSWFFSKPARTKINKAQTKQAKITGIPFFASFGLSHTSAEVASIFLQIPFSPCSTGQDTDAVVVIAITCPFR